MKKLLIATHNNAKLEDIQRAITSLHHEQPQGLQLQLCSLNDIGITEDIEETGTTFEENALLKARYYAAISDLPTLADDGGVEIDAFNGTPGIYTKRWFGNRIACKEQVDYILEKMKDIPVGKRGAQMKTVLAFVHPKKQIEQTVKGVIRGEIAIIAYTKNWWEGFPYRQVFFITEIGKYYNHHDMTIAEENRYNHRRQVLKQLLPDILKTL